MSRVYFGWWVLLALFLIYASSNGILIFTLPLFYPELINEFGWNEAEVTRPAAVFFVAAAVLHPFGGALLDRYSPRVIMLIGYGAITLALACYSVISALSHLMAIYIVFGLGLGLAGLVANMLVLTRWFVRYRGVAISLLLMGASFGGATFPLIMRQTLLGSGWRDAVTLLAVIGGTLMILPLIFLVRNRPQDMGLNPDGATQVSVPSKVDPSSSAASGPSLIDALKSPIFYLLAFATATLWFCSVGMVQHQAIYLGRDLHMDKSTIPLVFSVFFWAGIVGKASFGYLSDHFNKLYIMLASIISLAIGLIVLRATTADETVMMFVYAVIFGIGAGGAFATIQLTIAEFFVGHAYGKILGVFTFVDTMAGALGTQVIGMMRVAFDSYRPGLNLMILACAIAAVCVLFINRINERGWPSCAPKPA